MGYNEENRQEDETMRTQELYEMILALNEAEKDFLHVEKPTIPVTHYAVYKKFFHNVIKVTEFLRLASSEEDINAASATKSSRFS